MWLIKFLQSVAPVGLSKPDFSRIALKRLMAARDAAGVLTSTNKKNDDNAALFPCNPSKMQRAKLCRQKRSVDLGVMKLKTIISVCQKTDSNGPAQQLQSAPGDCCQKGK